MIERPTSFRLLALAGVISLGLSGCPVGPSYERPPAKTGEIFGNATEAEYKPRQIDVAWWHQFNDPRLEQLIAMAVRNNYDLKAAEAHLREARALFLDAGLNLLPHVTTRGNYTQLERSLDALNRRNFVPRNLNLYSVGFDSWWEIDIFGRIRRNIQSKEAEIEAAEADRRYMTLSVITELARNYFELRGHQNQLAVDQRNAQNQEATWKLTLARLEAGMGTELD
ncbi:MAG: TolC family protein, partial [Methylococcaceae bacterium]